MAAAARGEGGTEDITGGGTRRTPGGERRHGVRLHRLCRAPGGGAAAAAALPRAPPGPAGQRPADLSTVSRDRVQSSLDTKTPSGA